VSDSDAGGSSKVASRSQKPSTPRRNPFSAASAAVANLIRGSVRFTKESVAELRKVIWPTRSDLIRYTIVTIVFVSILVAFVWVVDYGLAKAVLYLFGDPDANSASASGG
jgi:preprotein translocase subunit SecE